MIRSCLLLILAVCCSQIYAQPGGVRSAGEQSQINVNRQYRGSTCGTDTVLYPLSKATGSTFWTLGRNAGSYYNTRFAQYYDAPTPVTIHGACIYAGLHSSSVKDSAAIRIYVVPVGSDSIPLDSPILADTTIQIFKTYLVNGNGIEQTKRCIEFAKSFTIDSAYAIVVHQDDPDVEIWIGSNSYNNNDGNGEKLAYYLYDPSPPDEFSGWYNTINEHSVWDVDWMFHPIISFRMDSSTQLSISPTACIGQEFFLPSDSAVTIGHRMYLTKDLYQWAMGNGDTLSADKDTSFIYWSGEEWTVHMVRNYFGWSTECTTADSFSVSISPLPDADFSLIENPFGSGLFEFQNNSSLADSIKWVFGSLGTSSDSTIEFTFSSGMHDILLIAYNGCGADTLIKQIFTSVDIAEDDKHQIRIYPNPVTESIWLNTETSGKKTIKLLDPLGKLIRQFEMNGSVQSVSIEDLTPGTYHMQVSTQDGASSTVKLLITP